MKTKAHEETQGTRRQPVILRVSDARTPRESPVDIGLSPRIAVFADRRLPFTDGLERLNSAYSDAIHYFAGSAFDKSAVSLSGVLPAGTPFFCRRNAMILVEFLAETEPGAIIGIVVCTADHSVETFLPA